MRLFVTGATGNIGSAVVSELLDAGHEVVGLARSDRSADALAEAGAGVHRGALDDLDSLRAGAAAADGVVHTAFIHDFDDFAASAETDRRAVAALAGALEDSDRPLVIASGTGLIAPGRVVTEADAGDPATAGPRARTEQELIAAAARGVRTVAVRFPPTVHGPGDAHGFIPRLIEHGVSAYAGDGSNRWPAVHRLDAAHLVRLAAEGAPAGSRLNAVADEGVPFREIAAVIGRHLDVPAAAIPAEEATAQFGWIGILARPTSPPRAPRRARSWTGRPGTPTCWPTSTRAITSGRCPRAEGDHGTSA